MKTIFLVFFFVIVGLLTRAQNIFMSDKLQKQWESTKELKTPESVFYNPADNILYVSNINGEPSNKNKKGFISKLSTDGKIVELKWVDGLNAPKGMGILNDKLYVSDNDKVIEIDLKTGKILKEYPADGAKFLNDIAIDANGVVYISDSGNESIYAIKDGKIGLWLKSEKLKGINGLLTESNRLLAGLPDRIVAIDYKEKSIKDFILNTGGIDGIVSTDKGYIVSDWQGNVHLVSAGKEKEKLLDTTPKNMNAADIEYIKEKKLLLVPTFGDDRVMGYVVK